MDVQTLSMMLNLSNVHANSNVLVCESSAGILTGAVMGMSIVLTPTCFGLRLVGKIVKLESF